MIQEQREVVNTEKVTVLEAPSALSQRFSTIDTVKKIDRNELIKEISAIIADSSSAELLEKLGLSIDSDGILFNSKPQDVGVRCFQSVAYYGTNRGVDDEGISEHPFDDSNLIVELSLEEVLINLQSYGREGGDSQLNVWISSSKRDNRTPLDDVMDNSIDGPGQLNLLEYILPKGAFAFANYRKPQFIAISFYDMEGMAQSPSIIGTNLDNSSEQYGIGIQPTKSQTGNAPREERGFYDAASKEFRHNLLHTFIIKL